MFSQKTDVIEAMDQMIVLSLYTDGPGPRTDEFNRLRERLTGSSTNPMYAIVSPWDVDKVLYQADYNQAIDSGFAERLGRASRRAIRVAERNAPATLD